MKIVYRKFSDWPLSIQNRLQKLTFRDEDPLFQATRDCPKTLHTWVVFGNKEILGWSACFRWESFQVSRGAYSIMLFVAKKYRRRGIGTQLYCKAEQWVKLRKKSIETHPHDKASYAFFDKVCKDGN